ncbi:MAG TPA: tetratricopeptide repeat protein [Bryobacteraceae bacterium]|nr:tetratricopeptide repeat protein [Bryobacteraceae bacterium]
MAAVAIGLYANSLANGFVSDDKIQLLKNPLVTSVAQIPHIFGSGVWSILGIPGSPGNYYRPLQFLVYLALYEGFGFHAAAFHLFMILLHAVNTLLLYLLVRRLWTPRIALAAGALFAVHPIHTEVVDWVAALPDLMVTTLALLGVLWLARRDDPPRGWRIAGHCGLYLAALLTKETGAMLLPLYAGFGCICRERGWRELRHNAALYAAMAGTFGIYLLMRRTALGSLAPGQEAFFHLTPLEFALSAVVLAGQYLAALLFPANLSYFHVFHPTAGLTPALLLAAVALAAIAAALWRFRPPLVAYGVFWIAVTLAPAFNLTGVGQNVFAERYLYLPSVGFCWIAGWAWDRLAGYQPRWAMAVAAVLLLACAGQAAARNGDWRDDYTLFQITLRQAPTSGWLHNWMAGVYVERHQFDRALAEERLAVEYEPRAPAFHENLGNILLVTDPRAAIAEFQKLLALQPGRAENHSDLGIALEAAGQPRQAAAEYETALRLEPGDREAQEGYRRVMARFR